MRRAFRSFRQFHYFGQWRSSFRMSPQFLHISFGIFTANYFLLCLRYGSRTSRLPSSSFRSPLSLAAAYYHEGRHHHPDGPTFPGPSLTKRIHGLILDRFNHNAGRPLHFRRRPRDQDRRTWIHLPGRSWCHCSCRNEINAAAAAGSRHASCVREQDGSSTTYSQ
jgi:hypothetical protein